MTDLNNDSSLVDVIQTDLTPVTTVAEAKVKKGTRQTNLATLVTQISEIKEDEVLNYPISVLNGLQAQAKRLSSAYKSQVEQLDA